MRGIFGDAANYVHVDLYENPAEVKLGAEPIETPILEEWGLHTGEWTFVVDADGSGPAPDVRVRPTRAELRGVAPQYMPAAGPAASRDQEPRPCKHSKESAFWT